MTHTHACHVKISSQFNKQRSDETIDSTNRQTEIERQTETGRDRQRQAETGRDRHLQRESEVPEKR